MDKQQIIETWEISNRIDLYLLDSIAEEHLTDQPGSKGRDVAAQFAHIHNVRLMWLKAAMPEALNELTKIEKDESVSKGSLRDSLTASGEAIARLLDIACESGKVKGFKPHVTAFLGYMIAHDAHHRSQVILALKHSGHKVDQKIAYGLWEWGSR